MAIIQISEIVSDTRWAKEVRIFGIPVWHSKELDLRTIEKKSRPARIGFQSIGDTSLLGTEEEDEEEIDTTIYGKEKDRLPHILKRH